MPLIHEATPKAKDAIRHASEERRMPSGLVCNPRIVWMIVAVTLASRVPAVKMSVFLKSPDNSCPTVLSRSWTTNIVLSSECSN